MLAERAELVARLSLKDDMSGKLSGVQRKMVGLGASAKRAGKAIGVGLSAGIAVGAAVVTRNISSGIESLAELEDATTSVDGAIKQLGLTGKVTSGQIAGWANEIEAKTQAAFDDKAITQAATTLLRYGKVAPRDLKTTLTVMTDLAAKTGSVESAASKLAKSLADPTKATRVLREVGVTLTEEQQKQIVAWVESGKLAKAQALILKEVGKQTKGAAAAMHGPMRDSQLVFADVVEDTQRALATGFLPVLEEIRHELSEELAKPSTLARIKDFGQGLAGGLRTLVGVVKSVNWAAVGTSFQIAGTGAKAIYDTFMGMPDWVKTAVLTGWGLNKVTGGAVGSLIGSGIEVGLKGVFGQFFAKGSSPANPMYVSAVGGLGGGVGGVAGGGGVMAWLSAALIAAPLAIAIGQALEPITTKWFMENTRRDIDSTGGTYQKGGTLSHGTVVTGHSLEERDDRVAQKIASLAVQTDRSRQAIVASGRTGDREIVAAIRHNRPILNVRVNVSNSVRTTVYRTGTTINRTSTGVRGALLGA